MALSYLSPSTLQASPVCSSLLCDCHHLEALWLQGCHPCSSLEMWFPQNAWVVGFESHVCHTPPRSLYQVLDVPTAAETRRPGKAARTSGPIFALTPGALLCVQLKTPCMSVYAFVQGFESRCRGRVNIPRPRGDPRGQMGSSQQTQVPFIGPPPSAELRTASGPCPGPFLPR